MAETTGRCQQGMDINYKGQWGYHPLLVSLANTAEPLCLVNRRGNRPSREGAAARLTNSLLCAGGLGSNESSCGVDTDFTQTKHLDGWHGQGVRFIFGLDAMPNLVEIAESLENESWKPLRREPRYTVETAARERPANVKGAIVRSREFTDIRLQSEEVAEFDYAPGHCRRSYRVVVVRKNRSVEKGAPVLLDDVRYFFHITSNRTMTALRIV